MSARKRQPKAKQESPLDVELKYFNRLRKRWIAKGHEGEWATVKGAKLLGIYPDIGSAYRAGVMSFGSVPFLVKQIKHKDDVAIIHRAWFPRRAE